jgi:hypothetical protein
MDVDITRVAGFKVLNPQCASARITPPDLCAGFYGKIIDIACVFDYLGLALAGTFIDHSLRDVCRESQELTGTTE